MTTFKFTGPEPKALLRDPKGILPDILVKKGDTFTTDDPRMIEFARELPMYEEVKDTPKANGKS